MELVKHIRGDSQQHHFEEMAAFAGRSVRAVEVNVVSECELKVNL